MSWSVMVTGDRKAAAARVEQELCRYEKEYAEHNPEEAVQIRLAREAILAQIARSPGKYVKVDAVGSHSPTWSQMRIQVEQIFLEISDPETNAAPEVVYPTTETVGEPVIAST